jgi:hypothetical protein
MRRTDLNDTNKWAHEVMLERARKMSPAERLSIVADAMESAHQMNVLAQHRLQKGARIDDDT